MQMIIRGFKSLLRFSGRDTRSQFWPYAAVVIVAGFVMIGFGMALAMQPIFEEALRVAQENPEAVTVQTSPTRYEVHIAPGAGFAPDFSRTVLMLGVSVALVAALLAAAVTRRLHDRGLPGFVGLAPLVFLTVGLFGMQRMMASLDSPEIDEGLFFLLFANNILYMAALAGLVILLALPGHPKPNRYGPAPAP